MIKRVKAEQLRIGMYIHDFNCGWLNHPFLTNSMLVDSEQIIRKVKDNGIREVYIDTAKGYDYADALTQEEVSSEIDRQINEIIKKNDPGRVIVPIQIELNRAREIRSEARKTIQNIMEDIRFGKQISTEKVSPVVDRMIESIFRNQDALITLSRIKDKDEYTYMHSVSVGALMISFGKYLGLDITQLREIGIGSILHDVGKVIVPQVILNKEDKLTEDELNIIKRHAEYSRKLLEQSEGMTELSITIAAQHHERIDGTGYPLQLKGDEIAFFSKALAIVDVYDAMTSKRCYQEKSSPTSVLKKLFEWSEYHYDRVLVQKFIRCVGIYPVGTMVQLNNGLVGVVIKHGENNLLDPVIRVVYNPQNGGYLRVPYEIDLAHESESDDRVRIDSYVSAEKMKIKPEVYL